MHHRRTARALVAAIAVSVLAMLAVASPASALTKKVDITLTSTVGCKYRIQGTITYGPLTTTTFVGTITVSGDGPACNGIITFNQDELAQRTAGRLTAGLNTSDLRSLSRVTWRGKDRAAAAFLNETASNGAICAAIRQAAGG